MPINRIDKNQLELILNVIESSFNEKWLNKKVKQAKQTGKWNFNPVPKGWFELKKRYLVKLNGLNSILSHEELKVIKLANDLESIKELKNYAEGIPKKKLKDNEFEKYAYLANIASLSVNFGYSVEFVLEGSNKTPDLYLIAQKFDFYIECKKKDAYLPKNRDSERWKAIQEGILNILDKHEANFSVLVMIASDMPKDLETEIYVFLENRIPNKEQGVFTNNKHGFSIALHKLDDSYEEFGIKIPTTQGGTYGVAIGKYAIDEQGKHYVEKRKRVQLYVFDFHNLVGISRSFLNARSQIPKESFGVIFVDIDITNIIREDLKDYLNMLSVSVKTILSNNVNRRLGAVVISAEIETGQYTYMTIRNINSDFPKDIIIPGEINTPA